MTTVPAYTIGGITRPELTLDANGYIILTPDAAAFAAAYGTKALYAGLPANTPFPPIPDSLSDLVDSNAAANAVVEGAVVNTGVGITASASSAGGLPVTYALTADSSNGGFTINPNTGVVTVANAAKIDFETAPGHAYSITVQANDGALTTSQTFTIAVTDVPLPTPVDSNANANSVVEGAAVGSTVGVTATAADPNGPTTTYSLIGDTSGGGFTINAATGVVTVADSAKLDFETAPGHAHTITVQASNGLATTSQTFTIGVADAAPTAPVDSNGAANTVVEGAANGTIVGVTAFSTDINGGAVTYSLVGDSSGGGFTIDATTGVITVADSAKIDFETAAGHAYTVTARASDGTLTSSQNFTIAVSDVAPTTPVDSNAAANNVDEGAAAGTLTGITASSSDINGPNVTYSLTGDTSGGGFTVNAATGVVTVANPNKIDYETSPGHAYSVTVQASDGTLTHSQTFTIAVNDLPPNLAPDGSGADNTVAEGAAAGTTVGVTVAANDPGGGAVTYALIGDTSGGGFTINSTTGVVTVADPSKIDFESSGGSYIITAQASDGILATSQTYQIIVTDVAPSAPVDSNAGANTITEGAANGSTVGITASATDVNGPAVTYSLTGDTSGGGFTINAVTGVVTVADSSKIDFETAAGHAYTVTAQASDGHGGTNSQTFSIGVSDVAPSAPVDSNGAANTVTEGAANGSTVGVTASSTDVNGPAVTYSLTGDTSGGGFTINAATGVVTVADSSKLDYEAAPGHAYTITAQASDGTLTNSQTFTIGVIDAGPSTPVDGDAAANTVAEGAANGSTVGITASSTDVNGPPVTWSLVGDTSGGGFTINATTGVIIVADSSKLDFESSGGSYTVVAQSSDGTLTNSNAFVISVTDVAPSAPVDSDAGTNQVAQGAGAGTYVGVTASSTDVNGPAVTYSLVGDTSGGGFTINAATGAVTVADPSKIIYNAGSPTYDVTVDSSDGTLHNQQTFTVNVILDAPPVVTASHTLNYTENQAASAIDPALTVTDADNANLVSATVQISGNYVNGEDVLGFTNQNGITGSFNAATGTLTLTGASSVANYQTALASVTYFNTSDNPSGAARTVTFITNDGTLDSAPATDTINITPVNDAPVVTAGHTLNYTENQAATAFDPALTVTDVDSANLVSATVQISGNYANGQDVLGFTDQNGITGSFNAATGTLTLTGSSSVANYQTALDSVTYVNSSENPSGLARTVTIITNDGTANSVAQTDTINVTPVNDAPVTTAGGTLNYTENQAATAIDASVNVSDVDSANMSGATVQITGGYVNGEDILGFADQNGIAGSFNAATGTLTLTGSSSVANYKTALDSVTYFNSSDNPSGADRTVSYTVNDGALNSNTSTSTIHVTPVNDAPVVSATGTLAYTENQAATAIAPALTLGDADTATLTSASVQISANYVNGEDVLAFANTANITGSFNAATGTLTLTGTDTVAHYQAALASVTYSDTSDNPSTAARTVTFTADDGQAANHLSAGSDHTINVTAVDDAPVNNNVPANFTVMSGFTHAITGLSVSDVDAAGGNNITTTLTSAGGGIVNIGAVGGGAAITGNGTGVVTLTGTITEINASLGGSVVYTAADGATGSSQTTLTIATNDQGHTGTGGPITDTDVIQVGVTQQVWFINGDQTGVDSTAPRGSQTNPFTDVHEFNTSSGPGTNDIIYVKAGTYTGEGINLKDGQTLLGDDQALSLPDPFGGPAIVIESASGTRPVIHVTAAGDQAIDLAQNNTVAGIDIQTDAGTFGLDDGQGAGGNAVGTLNVSHMAISGAGQAVDIDQGGALNVTLDSVNSTGGAEGIQLGTTVAGTALTGSFSGGTGAISGSTTSGFLVGDGTGGASTGGTLTVSYNGTITASNAASVVNIQDHATGAVTLTGNLTHNGTSGAGVVLDDNSGNFTFSGTTNNLSTGASNAISVTDQTGSTTVAFSGALNIDTTSGTGVNLGGANGANTNFNFTGGNLTIDTTGGNGFVATGGGTVIVTGTGNHINSGSGTALNISNTNIGSSNVTFHDISSSGASSGIILNNTGSSGGLTVTGDGGASNNHSGGQIVGSTGAGISLASTKDVSLNYLDITSSGTDGINASGVNGLTLTRSNVTDNAGGAADEGLQLSNMTGTITLTNDLVSGSPHNNLFLQNNNINLTALNITNSTFQNTLAGTGADGVLIEAQGTSVIGAITIKGSTFSGNKSTGLQVQTEDTSNIQNLTVGLAGAGNGNTFSGNNAGVDFDVSQNSDLTFSLVNNSFQNNHSQAINVFTATASGVGASVTGKIQDNIIGTQGTLDSGSAIGSGIRVIVKGGTHGEFTIDGNQIHEVANARGIDLEGFHTASGGGGADFNVINNAVFQPTGTNQALGGPAGQAVPLASIWISSDNEVASGDEIVRAVVSGNTVYDPVIWQPAFGGEGAIYLQGNTFTGPAHLQIEGTGSVLSTVATNNTISNDDNGDKTDNITLDGDVALIAPGASGPFPLLAASGGVQASTPTLGEMHLSQSELDWVVAAAIAQWAAAGASATQLAALHATTFSVGDLAAGTVGEESAPAHITIDVNADGHGWFVDPTPSNNSEFTHAANAAGTDLFTDPTNAAAGHLDLLTTVTHELGHVLDLPDLTNPAEGNDLMYISLVDGERRLPDAADVANANPTPDAPLTPAIANGPAPTPTDVGSTPASVDAGHGGVTLTGTAAADNFVFTSAALTQSAPTHVVNYSFAQGDTFDFSALTSQFHGSGVSDALVVRAVEDSSGSFATLQVNLGDGSLGSKTSAWTNVAQIDGAHAGDSLNVLVDSQGAVHHAQVHVDLLV